MEYYRLTSKTIDMLSDKIGEMYQSAGSTKKETFRAKLLLEEALLKYKNRLGEDVELYYRSYRIFNQFRFSIRIRSASFDPFTLEENPMSFMLQSIMSSFETGMPTWKYRNLENEIVFTVRKKAVIGNLTKIVIGVIVALVAGIICRIFVPEDALNLFVFDYVNPISNAYSGLFCVMTVILTFMAIVLSIVHIGDMASIGALGGRIMRRFFVVSGIAVIVFTAPLLPFFEITDGGAHIAAAKSIYDVLIGFIPTNIVAPFLNFNSVHIMIVGAMFGLSLLAMGQKGTTLIEVFDECNLVAVYSNNFLNRFIFIYVALNIFAIVTVSDFVQIKSAGKMVIPIVIAEIILLVYYSVNAMIRSKLPLKKFIKTMMPATLVCLSSANLSAAFNSIFDSLFDVGVDEDTANLSVNLGSVFFQPACTIVFVFSSLFMAAEYNVEISLVWIIMSILLSIILVGSMPNIPGASVSLITLLYAQLGIPNEALVLMITINAILQFPTVAVDVWCLQSEIICIDRIRKKHKLEK